jgi:cell volume regulation protein A
VQALDEIIDFGLIVLIVAGGGMLAVLSNKATERVPIPAPAIFLLTAAVASDLIPELSEWFSIRGVERLATVALILILFDGGMHVGWRQFRSAAITIASLGVLGTFASALLLAVGIHYVLGFSWDVASIISIALAPTDPAVVFSVLGNREVAGRSGTILQGESGANDPVGIAALIAVLELTTGDGASIGGAALEFAIAMSVGIGMGVLGAAVLLRLMRYMSLPSEGLYPLRTLAGAGVIYGVASLAHGSGFLAVFVTGILIGDANAPYKPEIERFHGALASLGEIVVFVALGLTVDVSFVFTEGIWRDGIVIALLLALLIRPLVAGVLLIPVEISRGEKLFVMWAGLKGAVPILLGTFALIANAPDAQRIYHLIFVVVAISVIVQGGSVPFAAARWRVPMRWIEPEPWDMSIRLRREPRGVHRFVVSPGSPADGAAIRDLPLGEEAWISLIVHDGEPVQARGSYVLHPGDEVMVIVEPDYTDAVRELFEESRTVN